MIKIIKHGGKSAIRTGKPEGRFEAQCPWCGGVIHFDETEVKHDPDTGIWYTKCPECTKQAGAFVRIHEWSWHRLQENNE
jgi:hypothetical protein